MRLPQRPSDQPISISLVCTAARRHSPPPSIAPLPHSGPESTLAVRRSGSHVPLTNPVPGLSPLSPFRLSLLGRFPCIASTFYWISAACSTEARVEVWRSGEHTSELRSPSK